MRYIFSVLIIMGIGCQVFAQIQDNSPYSRFGLGDLVAPNMGATSAMGNITVGYNSIYHLNPSNPASYAALNFTAFETGIDATFSSYTSGDEQARARTGDLSYIALGFPIFNPLNRVTKKRDYPFDWGASFGLVPHSRVAYNVSSPAYSEAIQDSLVRYSSGDGERYKLYFGTGFRYKGLSAGFNTNYLFGKVSRDLFVDFGNTLDYQNDISTRGLTTGGWVWDFGLQYQYTLGKLSDEKEEAKRRNKAHIIIGLTATPGTTVGLRGDDNFGRTRSSYSNYEAFRENTNFSYDTIFSNEVDERMTLPSSFGAAITYKKDRQFLLSAEYKTTAWSSYEDPIESQTLSNTWRGAFGMELTPNDRSLDFLKRVRYRIGGYYGSDPRVINGMQLQNYGLTAGFGLPIVLPRGVPSFVNIGFEVGQHGHPDLIQETYFRTSLSFTLNDNSWFYKQKYR